MNSIWNYHTTGHVCFGWGAAAELGGVARRMGLGNLLVVTDRVLEQNGLVDRVVRPLAEEGISHTVFNGGEAEPTLAAVLKALDMAKTCKPDGVVGLGGGSNMDMAKIVATVLSHGGQPTDYAGQNKIPGPILPVLCLPTTAGTGSEVSSALVFTDPGKGMKVSCLSQHLRPNVAIVDPDLTMTCPARVTADSGIDALVHAIEAFTATDFRVYEPFAGKEAIYQGANPMADLAAREAIALCGRYLARAVADGADREARENMAYAAMLGGLAFSNAGVALVHGMEYAVASEVHVSHGAGNGLLVPHLMRYNLEAREERFAEIARLLGAETSGLSTRQAAELAVERVAHLSREIGIPQRLRDLGMKREQLPVVAERAKIERLFRTNPRRPQEGDLLQILEGAW
jgi:alcohol dehydrogenase class IV